MQRYLIHLHEQPDGSLPPELWETWEGDDAEDAILRALERCRPHMPTLSYLADHQGPRHENGAPMAIRQFQITLALVGSDSD